MTDICVYARFATKKQITGILQNRLHGHDEIQVLSDVANNTTCAFARRTDNDSNTCSRQGHMMSEKV